MRGNAERDDCLDCGVSLLRSWCLLYLSYLQQIINHTIAQSLNISISLYLPYFPFCPSFTFPISPQTPSYMLSRVSQLTKQVSIMSSTKKAPDINLYTTQTPNGIKISITLEELEFGPLVSERHTLCLSCYRSSCLTRIPLISFPPP